MTKLIKRLDLRRSGGRSITSGLVTTLAFSGRRRGVYKSIVEVNGTRPEDYPSLLRCVRALRQEAA